MVLSGSFWTGGWGDGEGGRAALVRRMDSTLTVQVWTHPAPLPALSQLDRGPWSWEQPPRIRAVAPQCSRARLHDWLGRWHVFASDYTSFCPKGPKPPSPCSLEHGSSWFIASGFIPLPLSQYFHSFFPSLSKISFSPATSSSSFSAFPLNFCLTSHGHISILVMSYFLLSQQKYLSNCSSNLPVASLPPSVFPALLLILLNHPFLHALNERTFQLQPRMFVRACPEIKDSDRFL